MRISPLAWSLSLLLLLPTCRCMPAVSNSNSACSSTKCIWEKLVALGLVKNTTPVPTMMLVIKTSPSPEKASDRVSPSSDEDEAAESTAAETFAPRTFPSTKATSTADRTSPRANNRRFKNSKYRPDCWEGNGNDDDCMWRQFGRP